MAYGSDSYYMPQAISHMPQYTTHAAESVSILSVIRKDSLTAGFDRHSNLRIKAILAKTEENLTQAQAPSSLAWRLHC